MSTPGPVRETHSVQRTVSYESDRKVVELNQYVLIKNLGRGAYGKVKLCLDKSSGRPYAVKIIKRSLLKKKRLGMLGGSGGVETKVKREIAIMKKLHHPNVVRLHEVIDDEASEKLYLVLEYVDGGCVLSERDREVGVKFPLNKARSYFRDALQGLSYLHSQDIIHHDLKPENMMVTSGERIKIGDLGVSLIAEGGNDEVAEVPGTPAFVAPECTGGTFSGKTADVWALGVCLYQFVTGSTPFVADNIGDMFDRIVSEEPDYPRDLPATLVSLLRGILEKDPSKRLSLDDIKTHPWVTKHGAEPVEELGGGIIDVTEEEIGNSIAIGAGLLLQGSKDYLEDREYQPGDMIIRKGDVGTEMYFIDEGDCHVLSDDGSKVVATRKAGAFIGEMALLISDVRTASVRAATHVKMLVLSKANLDKILSKDSSSRQLLLETAKMREEELKKYDQ